MKYNEIRFGIEIETVGATRKAVAEAIQRVVGGEVFRSGYTNMAVAAGDGREWKVVHDGSLNAVPEDLRAEIVSPILTYSDMETLQRVVRACWRAGARVNYQCGIHVHVDAAHFDGAALGNLAKMVFKQEPIILKALGVSEQRLARYTKRVSPDFIKKVVEQKPQTKDQMNPIWYGYKKNRFEHYDNSRYHGLNLHNVWFRGTVEFRWFESTLHAGKVKSYVQLCLCLAAKALNARNTKHEQRVYSEESAKYDFRVFLLGLGMIGDEFETARLHLLKLLPGSSAFKGGAR